MNQPPQGNYQPRPMPQQPPYPQQPPQYPQPAQYPQGPAQYQQGYPQQYPGGVPYPVKRGPSKGVGVLKVLVGLCLSLGMVGALAQVGHEGIAVGAILGVILGLGLRWMVTGSANVVGKNIPVLPSLVFILIGGAIGAFGGPPGSDAFWKVQEQSKWDELVSYNSGYVNTWQWDYEYFGPIPPKYQRAEAPGMKKFVDVKTDIQNSNLVGLRTHVYDIQINHKGDPNYAQALDAAAGELKKRYDEVLAKLATPGGEAGAGAEFPVDEALRTAFKDVLTDLARAPEADIFVAFKNSSVLDAPEGHEANLEAEAVWVRKNTAMTVMDPPKVIDPGAAFSPAYDVARRGAFLSASGDAFRALFDANLLTFKPLESGVSRDGKFVLEVSSAIRRTETYFHYTSTAYGVTTLTGFAFALAVDWELKLFGRDGKLIYEKKVSSVPGSELSISPQASDPEWAVYSILMDSAYYNYAREVVGSFGVPPPLAKTTFAYSNYGG